MLLKIGTKAMMKLRIQVPRIREMTTFRLKYKVSSEVGTIAKL